MIDNIIILSILGGVICFALGYRMGHAVGMNDGLRRAHDIMDEAHRSSWDGRPGSWHD